MTTSYTDLLAQQAEARSDAESIIVEQGLAEFKPKEFIPLTLAAGFANMKPLVDTIGDNVFRLKLALAANAAASTAVIDSHNAKGENLVKQLNDLLQDPLCFVGSEEDMAAHANAVEIVELSLQAAKQFDSYDLQQLSELDIARDEITQSLTAWLSRKSQLGNMGVNRNDKKRTPPDIQEAVEFLKDVWNAVDGTRTLYFSDMVAQTGFSVDLLLSAQQLLPKEISVNPLVGGVGLHFAKKS